MRKCPKCNKDIPSNTLLYGVKKQPIVCPHCQSKFIYDLRNMFLLCGWWSILFVLYFLHKVLLDFQARGHFTNIDKLLFLAVIVISFLIRFKFVKIKSID